MSLTPVSAGTVLAEIAAEIEGLTPKTESGTPWRDVGDEWHEAGAPRTFSIEFDIEGMREGYLFGTGDTSYIIPLVIRIAYAGLSRIDRNAMMIDDKKDLLALFRRREGVSAGRIPPEVLGFESKLRGGSSDPDSPTYVEHRVMVQFLGDTST